MFKNIQVYRLPKPLNISLGTIQGQLEKLSFNPCGAMEMESRGWEPPVKHGDIVHAVGGQWLLSLCIEKRLLPGSVVKQATDERAAEIELSQGFKLGRKQLRELKERVVDELMPRAFTAKSCIPVWIDPINGWLVVGASGNKAETAVTMLTRAVDNLPWAMFKTINSPATSMRDWLATGNAPLDFSVDMDCELKSPTDGHESVRYANHPLEIAEIREHLSSGKDPVRLAMTWDDRMSFVLTDKMEIRRLKLLDVVMQDTGDEKTAEEEFDANFLLMAGELARFLPDLAEALGGEDE